MTDIIKTPAKINAFLKIKGIDSQSSLHFIETLIVPIDLYDVMEISPDTVFSVETIGVGETIPTEKNIVYKIFKETELFLNRSLPKFRIIIRKNIPTGAGLGGGSSNGAGFLLFLNKFLGLGLSIEQMTVISSKTGSDVPFFLFGSPAVVSGTGQIVEPVKIINPGFFLLLIYPDIIVNTGVAYALFDKKKLTKYTSLNINSVRKRVNGSLKDWLTVFSNDFEDVVFEKWPLLNELKFSLESSGADKVFMSGSGSSLVAVFSKEDSCDAAFEKYAEKYRTVKKIELLTG